MTARDWSRSVSWPVNDLARAQLVVSVKDRQENVNRIERSFSVGKSPATVQPAKPE